MQDPNSRIVERGREILRHEGEAILRKAELLDGSFQQLVERILSTRGRVAVTGVGKSGVVGEKISATLSSTGTPSFFLRPVEALHGDLGMLTAGDVLVAISNSGETAEVLAVSNAAKALGIEIMAFTGGGDSSLSRLAGITLDTGVDQEACPLGLAPTTSTTVTLALGDALAMVLLEERGFTAEHYARFHPGGSLGERLRYRVLDLMRPKAELPLVDADAPVPEALEAMTRRGNLGLALVVEDDDRLVGIVTDGDIRRLLGDLEAAANLLNQHVRDVMTRDPRTIVASASAKDALHLMEVHGITSLAVTNHGLRIEGLVHLHDILGRGKIVL